MIPIDAKSFFSIISIGKLDRMSQDWTAHVPPIWGFAVCFNNWIGHSSSPCISARPIESMLPIIMANSSLPKID